MTSEEQQTIQKAYEYADQIVKPPLKQIGCLFADKVRYWRYKNQINILAKAKALHEKKGISPHQIPVKTLVNMIEYSSLEEEENMQELWANLLANATNSENPYNDHNRLIHILKELSSDEALILKHLYNLFNEEGIKQFNEEFFNDLYKENPEEYPFLSKENTENHSLIIDNLMRLNLIKYLYQTHEFQKHKTLSERLNLNNRINKFQLSTTIVFTNIGLRLMDECHTE
jgi:hypothetical protein